MTSKFTQAPANAKELASLINKYHSHINKALEQAGTAMPAHYDDYKAIHLILLKIDKTVKNTAGCLLKESKFQRLKSLAEKVNDLALKEFLEKAFTLDESKLAMNTPISSSKVSPITPEKFGALLTFWSTRPLIRFYTPELKENKSVSTPVSLIPKIAG